jgi:hypothetical protein
MRGWIAKKMEMPLGPPIVSRCGILIHLELSHEHQVEDAAFVVSLQVV